MSPASRARRRGADGPGDRAAAQARALGHPTRQALYRDLLARAAPQTLGELVDRHPGSSSAIRQHLAQLVAAGLVLESVEPPRGPGRPRLLFRADPAAVVDAGPPSPYAGLAVLLAECVRSRRAAREVGRGAGREWARRGGSGSAADRVTALMFDHGFDPESRSHPGHRELVLRRCPFHDAAVAAPDVVCDLHLGLAQGAVDGTGGGTDGDGVELVVRDPRRGYCRLIVPDDGG